MISKFFPLFVFLVFSSFKVNVENIEDLNIFYDEFVCEEKDITAGVGLTSVCGELPPFPPGPIPPSPPSPPSPPPAHTIPPLNKKGYFPVIITNNSGIPSNEIYLFSYAPLIAPKVGPTTPATVFQLVQTFPGQMVPQAVTSSTFSPNYSYTLNEFPISTTGSNDYLLYFPNGITSARIYVSIQRPLYFSVTPGIGGIGINSPPPFLYNDPNFNVLYDFMELTLSNSLALGPPYIPSVPFIDNTQVDAFGLSIQLGLYTFDPSQPSEKNQLIQNLQNASNLAGFIYDRDTLNGFLKTNLPAPAWDKLLIPFRSNPYDGGTIPSTYLRVLSPKNGGGGGIVEPKGLYTIPVFPVDYLSNPTYGAGESYLDQLFKYYETHSLYLQDDLGIPPTNEIFKGNVVNGNQFYFKSKSSSKEMYLVKDELTVGRMYSASILVHTTNATTDDQDALSGYFSCAFVVGLLGVDGVYDNSSNPLNKANLRTHIPLTAGGIPTTPVYYHKTFTAGTAAGLWYSLYAEVLHKHAIPPTKPPYPDVRPDLGKCYAYDFDDKLGLSSTVAASAKTPYSSNIFANYFLNGIPTVPTGVFNDSTPYNLTFVFPPHFTLEYRQGTSGPLLPILSGNTVNGAVCTEANPLQLFYTSTATGVTVSINIYPKFQFATPNGAYGVSENVVVSGILFEPLNNSTTPADFEITLGAGF